VPETQAHPSSLKSGACQQPCVILACPPCPAAHDPVRASDRRIRNLKLDTPSAQASRPIPRTPAQAAMPSQPSPGQHRCAPRASQSPRERRTGTSGATSKRPSPPQWPQIIGDLAAPISFGPAAGVTRSWCQIQLTITTAMHTDSLSCITTRVGNALLSAESDASRLCRPRADRLLRPPWMRSSRWSACRRAGRSARVRPDLLPHTRRDVAHRRHSILTTGETSLVRRHSRAW
jgi:hypothetical protein